MILSHGTRRALSLGVYALTLFLLRTSRAEIQKDGVW